MKRKKLRRKLIELYNDGFFEKPRSIFEIEEELIRRRVPYSGESIKTLQRALNDLIERAILIRWGHRYFDANVLRRKLNGTDIPTDSIELGSYWLLLQKVFKKLWKRFVVLFRHVLGFRINIYDEENWVQFFKNLQNELFSGNQEKKEFYCKFFSLLNYLTVEENSVLIKPSIVKLTKSNISEEEFITALTIVGNGQYDSEQKIIKLDIASISKIIVRIATNGKLPEEIKVKRGDWIVEYKLIKLMDKWSKDIDELLETVKWAYDSEEIIRRIIEELSYYYHFYLLGKKLIREHIEPFNRIKDKWTDSDVDYYEEIHNLICKECKGELHPFTDFFDHVRITKDRIIILQPYNAYLEDFEALINFCKKHGYKFYVTGTSEHYPYHTFSIILYR